MSLHVSWGHLYPPNRPEGWPKWNLIPGLPGVSPPHPTPRTALGKTPTSQSAGQWGWKGPKNQDTVRKEMLKEGVKMSRRRRMEERMRWLKGGSPSEAVKEQMGG